MDFSACDGFDLRSKSFTGGVDGIGAHRVTDIIDEMNDEEGSDGRVIRSCELRDRVRRRRIS